MILGIVAFVLFIMACLRLIDKRIRKRSGIFTKIHLPVSIALVVVVIAHIVMTVPVWKMRTFLVLLTGFGAFAFILIACIGALKNKVKLHRVSAVLAALLIVIHIVVNIMGFSAYQSQISSTAVSPVDLAEVPDGVYEGEHDVSFIYAKVEVAVKDHAITDITILEHRNERGKPAEIITDEIVAQQRVDVDAVTSATNSSTVIKKAVENALRSAMS